MARVDPWTSVRLRAHALNLASSETAFLDRAREREAFFQMLKSLEMEEELGLKLRSPAEEMPWTSTPFGSWLHHFWTAMHAMYPAEWWQQVNSMSGTNRDGADGALVFLEADPWCFRSGYTKQDLFRFLRRVDLLQAQRNRLAAVLLQCVRVGPRMEFREACRTARIVDGREFRAELQRLVRHRGVGTEQRATWMLEALIRANGE